MDKAHTEQGVPRVKVSTWYRSYTGVSPAVDRMCRISHEGIRPYAFLGFSEFAPEKSSAP